MQTNPKRNFEELAESFKVASNDPSDGKTSYLVPFDSDKEFRLRRRKHQLTRSAIYQTPRALLVAMVSTFDAYLGRLLRCIFLLKPELINASQRVLTFSEIVAFDSLDSAREHIIDTEISTFLRDSHIEHFEWLENRLGIPLRKGLASWPTFVEVTQRRNLFVHCDGIVSHQYLDVCCKQGVDTELSVGDHANIDEKYFAVAFECLFEIGVKLAHVVWRKLSPDDLKGADEALNEVCFDLLQIERFSLAHELLTFATDTLKKHSSALNRRIMVINRGIAAKFGEIGDVQEAIGREDWSDCGLPFELAVAVLEDRFSDASEIMRKIGTEEELVNRAAYDTWPLFRAFREREEFHVAYRDLFGDEFKIPQVPEDDDDEQPSRNTEEKES